MTATLVAASPTIHRAGPAEVATVARTLAWAFEDDPVLAWCVPDPARRACVLPRLFELAATTLLPHGRIELTDDHAAAALWSPPGRSPVGDDEALDFEACVARLAGRDAGRTLAVMAILDELRPTADHWGLWFLGVVTHRQGNGLGSALLGSVLRRCDREGAGAFLHATSEHSRRLYERHGFVATADHAPDAGPPLWAMWREPR